MSSSLPYRNPGKTSNHLIRAIDQRDRQRKLVGYLRGVCYVGSLLAFDSPGLHQRCTLVRLIDAADAALRQLVNAGPANSGRKP